MSCPFSTGLVGCSFPTYLNFIVIQVENTSLHLSFAFYFAYIFIFYCHVLKFLFCHLLFKLFPTSFPDSTLLTSTIPGKWIFCKCWVLPKAGKVHFFREPWLPSGEDLFVTKICRFMKQPTFSWIFGRERWRIQVAGIIWVVERTVAWCQKCCYESAFVTYWLVWPG